MDDQTIRLLGLIGGIAGGITLVWRLFDAFKAFLHISIAVEQMEGPRIKVRTVVENSNSISRKIDAAFLLVSPQYESANKTVVDLLSAIKPDLQFKSANDMVRIITLLIKERKLTLLTSNSGQMIIPLPFYYAENYDVADENLSFEYIINTSTFPNGVYEIRFYIERIPRLHRLVQAAFEVG
jgi:hypothetical protein